MEALQRIELFDNLFFISLGVAIVGLAMAAIMFFYFDIPKVFSLNSGHNKRKAVEKMREKGESGKSMRSKQGTSTRLKQYASANSDSGAPTGNTSSIAPKAENLGGGALPEEQATTLLDSDTRETTLLNDEQQTTVLAETQQTTVLREEKAGTTVLKQPTRTFGSGGMTAKLTERPQRQELTGLNFQIVEQIVMLHTEENI